MGAGKQPRLSAGPAEPGCLCHHCWDKDSGTEGSSNSESHGAGATASSCSSASPAAHSHLSFPPLLSSPPAQTKPWSISGVSSQDSKRKPQTTAPQWQDPGTVSSPQPGLSEILFLSPFFLFYPSFFLEKPTPKLRGHNTPVVCHPTLLPADLFLCGMCLFQLVFKPLREDI